jgi:soluble epoxide hydrolase/lipid-phosphate phosphatase
MVERITPNDPRIQYKTAVLNGVNYSYILAEPTSPPKNTIFLIHGFPDLSFGWRYQIPLLTSLGLRVVAPDMMGYGGTDAPESINYYTYKRAADDIAALAAHLSLPSIILGGHDWGGAIVYRVAMYHPTLITALFSICTPFFPPQTGDYIPVTRMPNFMYQLQFGGDLKDIVQGETQIREFLNAMFGGQGANRERAFDVKNGYLVKNGPFVKQTMLLSKEELDFYAKRYAIHGMYGPTSWYRNGPANHEDERAFAERIEKEGIRFTMPVLFVAGKRDGALPPALSQGMEKSFRSLTRGEVDASHWALWERPAEVNQFIREWLEGKISSTPNL